MQQKVKGDVRLAGSLPPVIPLFELDSAGGTESSLDVKMATTLVFNKDYGHLWTTMDQNLVVGHLPATDSSMNVRKTGCAYSCVQMRKF